MYFQVLKHFRFALLVQDRDSLRIAAEVDALDAVIQQRPFLAAKRRGDVVEHAQQQLDPVGGALLDETHAEVARAGVVNRRCLAVGRKRVDDPQARRRVFCSEQRPLGDQRAKRVRGYGRLAAAQRSRQGRSTQGSGSPGARPLLTTGRGRS